MGRKKFDVILPELEDFGKAPKNILWCTSCQEFEHRDNGGSYVPVKEAPISYKFWKKIQGYYGVTKCHTKWVKEGRPYIP